MKKLCKPLEAILASGFHASRCPVKRALRPLYRANDDVYHSNPAVYRSTMSVEPILYKLGRYNSASPSFYDRAVSTGAIYFDSATMVPEASAYFTSASPLADYRLSPKNAVAVSYTNPTSTYFTNESGYKNTMSHFRPYSVSPPPHKSAVLALQSDLVAILNTIVEKWSEEVAGDGS